jgi:hypothetical protein
VYLRGKKIDRPALAAKWRAACGPSATTALRKG